VRRYTNICTVCRAIWPPDDPGFVPTETCILWPHMTAGDRLCKHVGDTPASPQPVPMYLRQWMGPQPEGKAGRLGKIVIWRDAEGQDYQAVVVNVRNSYVDDLELADGTRIDRVMAGFDPESWHWPMATPQNPTPHLNPWGAVFKTVFDMAADSHLFRTAAELEAAGAVRDARGYYVRPSVEEVHEVAPPEPLLQQSLLWEIAS
jgi:hypothetical protein